MCGRLDCKAEEHTASIFRVEYAKQGTSRSVTQTQFGLLFNHEDGGEMFLRIACLYPNYMEV
jgi:hypothetical protein